MTAIQALAGNALAHACANARPLGGYTALERLAAAHGGKVHLSGGDDGSFGFATVDTHYTYE